MFTFINLSFSSSHFQAIQNTIAAETGKQVDFEKAVNIFKTKLYAKIEAKFLENWATNDLDTSIMHLECSKAQTKDEEAKWRPTGHPVTAQMRPVIVRELTKRKQFLQRQLNHQNSMIESLIPAVEQYRQQLKEGLEKRQQIKTQSEADMINLRKVDDQIDMITQNF